MENVALKQRLVFGVQDVAAAYGIGLASAHVLCSRYVRQGYFVRLKRNTYVLERNWERYGRDEFFKISNLLQVPSYISCTTALAFYEITTQVQQDWYENIGLKRTARMDSRGIAFVYHKFQARLYFGFSREDGVFIASPEKALLDAAHLECIGRYSLDWDALNVDGLDRDRLAALSDRFPERVKARIAERCRIS